MNTSEGSSFGHWLRERRRASDLTQEQLAERIGCAETTIQKIELGERRPSRQVAELLANYFRVPRDERAAFTHFARSGQIVRTGEVSDGEGEVDAPWREQRRLHTNLPVPPTALIGREREVAELSKRLLSDRVRLLTLTGPPGIGKTRLTLEVAAREDLAEHFADGVFFVDLAPIRDPGLVDATIARALGVREEASKPLLESLKERLSSKRLLLVLDNFEQVLAAAPHVAELLATCPWLKVLVTSREALHVRGERAFPVPPLEIPEMDDGRWVLSLRRMDDEGAIVGRRSSIVHDLQSYSAVALFVERVQDGDPEFELTEENAGTIAAICARLDGLPLAIELVAARANLFPPQILLERIGAGPYASLLHVGELQDLPARQKTLRDAIDWSYDLLEEGERTLFRRLSVFAGGCTLPATEAVCNAYSDLPFSMKDGLASLFEKSLLQVQYSSGAGDKPRFGDTLRWGMLETILEYARERLEEGDATGRSEARDVKRLHAEYYLALAEEAAPHLTGPDQLAWGDRLETEHDNLRAALAATVSGGQGPAAPGSRAVPDPSRIWLGLRLAGAAWQFWAMRGHMVEGRGWLQAALQAAESIDERDLRTLGSSGVGKEALARARLRALNGAGVLARLAGDFPAARWALESGLEIARRVGNQTEVAMTLDNLGTMAVMRGDYAVARRCYEECLAIRRDLNLELEAGHSLAQLGNVALLEGDYASARRLHEESLAIARRLADRQGMGHALHSLATIALRQGDYAEARRLDEETLAIARELGNRPGIAYSLRDLGKVAYELGDYATASRSLLESLELFRELGEVLSTIDCLIGLARVTTKAGQPTSAARLMGAISAMLESTEGQIDPADTAAYERDLVEVRTRLGEEAFASAWDEGRAMAPEQALAHALQ